MRSVCTVAAPFNGRRFASSTANSWLGCTWIKSRGKPARTAGAGGVRAACYVVRTTLESGGWMTKPSSRTTLRCRSSPSATACPEDASSSRVRAWSARGLDWRGTHGECREQRNQGRAGDCGLNPLCRPPDAIHPNVGCSTGISAAFTPCGQSAKLSRRWLISVLRRLDYQKMETMAELARRVGSLSPSLT